MKPRRKHHSFMIQPAGSELWVETRRQTIPALRKYHGKDRVKLDVRESPGFVVTFISLEFD